MRGADIEFRGISFSRQDTIGTDIIHPGPDSQFTFCHQRITEGIERIAVRKFLWLVADIRQKDHVFRQKPVRHCQLHLAWIGERIGLVPMKELSVYRYL